MSWSAVNPKKLAAASSDNTIFILEDAGDGFKKTGELTGHQSGVTFVNWSTKSEHQLVSASFDHTVRVWDTQTFECIAWSDYENKMHCAAFLPTGKFRIWIWIRHQKFYIHEWIIFRWKFHRMFWSIGNHAHLRNQEATGFWHWRLW